MLYLNTEHCRTEFISRNRESIFFAT